MNLISSFLATSTAFTGFPVYDSEAYCDAIAGNTSDIVISVNGSDCLTREAKMKIDAESFWPEISERNRSDCYTLAAFGGGSYTILLLCSVKSHAADLNKVAALVDDTPSKIILEKAPPCSNGAKKCDPWERDWENVAILQPNDFVTSDGTIYRMPY